MLEFIFKNQLSVIQETEGVESSRGSFIDYRGHPLKSRGKQVLIREYSQRIVEEIHEAARDFAHKDKWREELIDVLNFSTGLMIICGFNHSDLQLDLPRGPYNPFTRLEQMGRALFQLEAFLMDAVGDLKAKPWRDNPPNPNGKLFNERLRLFYNFLWIILQGEMSKPEIIMVHREKSQRIKERLNGTY